MERTCDGRVSNAINKLISSLYLLTPTTVQQQPENGGPENVRLSNSELEDLSQSVLWKDACEWSSEVKEIRSELLRGKRLSHSEICLRLKTLKLIDKKIREIDDGLLKFVSLKELTLTGNLIEHINPDNLPKQLEVLECCYNELCDINELMLSPPTSLVHLGLSHNLLCNVKFPSDKWSGLVSLDLSNNCLADLGLVVRTLISLTSLQNLLLMGNPLALASAYRAYVTDKLQRLAILDDVVITSDERKLVAGVAKKTQDTVYTSTAELSVHISQLTGLPQMQLPEETAESPQLTRYYLVLSYDFLPGAVTFQPNDVAKLENDTFKIGDKDIPDNSQDTSSSEVQFGPVPYHTRSECNFSKAHITDELTAFQGWLREGMTFRFYLQKATYSKEDLVTNVSTSRQASAKRPSSSKKDKQPEKKPGKKGKLSQFEEPGEEWMCSDKINFCIGSSSVKMTDLLDGINEMSDSHSLSITDRSLCALFQTDSKSSTTEGSDTDVHWSFKCSCDLRKIQTVADLNVINS